MKHTATASTPQSRRWLPATAAGAKTVSLTDAMIAYNVFRLGFGFTMLMHGLARFLDGIDTYALPAIASFQKVPQLPHALVVFSVYTIPCIEIVVGLLILLGLFTRIGLLGTFALLTVLLFGTAMQQSWTAVAFQLIYVLMVSILLLGVSLNTFSLDALFKKREEAP